MKKTPSELKSVLSRIDPESDLILVGGQAINIWASVYQNRIPELQQFLPFSSEDLDFVGSKIDAIQIQQTLGGDLTLNQNFTPSPNTGVLITQAQNRNLRIDFLASVFGLGDSEVAASAVRFEGREKLAGINLKILNPILCLEGKLKAYTGLPQAGRQDKKHLQISLLVVGQYVKDICQQNQPRDGLKLVEKIFKTAKSDAGLQVWVRDRLDLLDSIPVKTIDSLPDPSWSKFREIRLPQAIKEIAARRDKYQQIEANLNLRRESIANKQKRSSAFSEYLEPENEESEADETETDRER